jgi:hypothetical protein
MPQSPSFYNQWPTLSDYGWYTPGDSAWPTPGDYGWPTPDDSTWPIITRSITTVELGDLSPTMLADSAGLCTLNSDDVITLCVQVYTQHVNVGNVQGQRN